MKLSIHILREAIFMTFCPNMCDAIIFYFSLFEEIWIKEIITELSMLFSTSSSELPVTPYLDWEVSDPAGF